MKYRPCLFCMGESTRPWWMPTFALPPFCKECEQFVGLRYADPNASFIVEHFALFTAEERRTLRDAILHEKEAHEQRYKQHLQRKFLKKKVKG